LDDQAPPSAGASPYRCHQPDLAALPAVDRLLHIPAVAAMIEAHGHEPVKRAIRELLAEARDAMRGGARPPSETTLIAAAGRLVAARLAPRLPPVINLTGTVIHTNLGRALLAEEAVASVCAAMRRYGALEYDLGSGDRGDRDRLVEGLLCDLTGAEAATVVNNNAAAVLLALAALAARKEVVISHGELIEIGGAFRMPDIMKAAGCRLVAVGTTNRTHASDYERALGPRTGLLVRAHWSNYAITGFTSAVDEATLATIAHRHSVPFMVDLGAGALVDLTQYALPREPLPGDSLSAGADIVTFSGDKLLGGPQAGIVVGSRDAIAKLKRHPMKRALRCSKITLAALEATLRVYASGHRLSERLPVLALLTRPASDIRMACERVRPAVERFVGAAFAVRIEPCASQIGSGSLPIDRLPSAAIVVAPVAAKGRGRALDALSARLRALATPVIGRVHDDALWLDARCLRAEEEAELVAALAGAAP
jgi:L-seryl-tRNA(Ser) seleniumtransferase